MPHHGSLFYSLLPCFSYALPVHADDHEEAPVTTEEAPADEADAAPYEGSYEVFTESEFCLITVSNFRIY